ncbi:unnamed protein product [Allacma fusca]|uniref:Heat shock protein 70 n=1 Tax=Allacma fusca TaxID=39272 RepID=A0A8J2NQQ4_9HEXA|nr:unnamed protein product [Allacma fusca]
MESRNDIASRLTSTFVKEFTYSSRKDEDWWQLELEKELLAINDQIDSNEEHALEVEQRKKELMQNFVSKATDSESINEDGLDELIESYTISFSKSTNNENIVKNFRQDLQREKARILRKKQEDLQVAQLEKVLDQLLNEYRSLLQKNGSSQNNKMKQQTLQKLEMLARRLQIDHYEYQARLISSMESILEEYQELEKSHMTEEKIKTIVEQVNKIYHEEMSRHFATPKYYSLQDMTDFHSDATREAITKVPGARADEEDIRNRIHNSLNESFKEFDNKNAMNVPTSFAIGIDLGTTYCCVGVFKNGQVEVIKNELGKKTTPSYVYYSIEGDVVVGETAKNQSHSNPERTIYEVKRLIGRDINDPAIQSDIAKWPFQVVSERGIAKVHVGEVTYFPEEVSAQILAKLKQVSEEYLNQKVTHAVITVPAYFTDGQKAATKRAGEEAGLEILRIISEPTAAAIAYNLNWTEGSQPTKGLVYDLGGGTFDVALFTAKKGDIKIVNVGGDTHLGGVDFDNELVLHCCHEFQKLTGVNLLANQESKNLLQKAAVNRKLMRLKRSCEQYKKDLSTAEIITVAIDNIHENQDLRIKVSRVQFERMIDTYIDKSLEVVDKVLKEAQTKKDDVEEIVLIGGSTRIPRIQNRLMEFFGTAINKKIDPDEAVAVGAAYEAAVLNGRRAEAKGVIIGPEFAPRGFSVLDITPMAYGIEIDGGDMCILIPKQSQVPIEVSRNFLTSYHHQTSVQIVIYEGENPKARDNTLVGEFYLNGIPPALAGEHNVQVTMKVSPEGMINVAATCIANGIRKELTVRANKRSMGRRERIRQTA